MQIFVTALLEQCRRHRISAELIIVEWNPPPDRPPLSEALRWPVEAGPCTVRIIEVPAEVHRRFKHSDGLALYQMIAKNVGIRRARGQFVLATNIDILFSDELMQFIAGKDLTHGRMYRIDRHDVMADVPEAPVEEQLAWCKSHLIRVNAIGGTFPTMPNGVLTLESNDIADKGGSIALGTGWYFREVYRGKPFRWFENDAEITIEPWTDAKRTLMVDIAPGPGVKFGPMKLDVLADGGASILSTTVKRRSMVMIPVPHHNGLPVRLRLHVSGGGHRLASDPRTMNARVMRCHISKAPVIALPVGLREKIGLMLGRGPQMETEYSEKWPDFLHLYACGDFTMLAREHWFDLRGYPEFDMFAMNIDSLFCWTAHYGGAKQQVLEYPMRTYHIEHDLGSTPEGQEKLFQRMEEKGVPWLAWDQVMRWACDMSKLNAPIIFNRDNWGLGTDNLKETLPHRPA